jgi:hypothetical protein
VTSDTALYPITFEKSYSPQACAAGQAAEAWPAAEAWLNHPKMSIYFPKDIETFS